MGRKGDFIERNKFLIAGFLIGVLVFTFYYTDQGGIQEKFLSYVKKETAPDKIFQLRDACGPVPGFTGISHSMPDEDSCLNECRARCLSNELEYKNAKFMEDKKACNTCECVCQ
jgi:hypothetical protein